MARIRLDIDNDITRMRHIQQVSGTLLDIVQIQTVRTQARSCCFQSLAFGSRLRQLDFNGVNLCFHNEPVQYALVTGHRVIAKIGNHDREN